MLKIVGPQSGVMPRLRAVLAAMLASLALSSCSGPPLLILLNNSGATIEVIAASRDGQTNEARSLLERTLNLRVRISQSRPRSLGVIQWRDAIVILRSGDCRLTFEIPFGLNEHYSSAWPQLPYQTRGFGPDPIVQLEVDQTLYLAPAGAQRAWDVDAIAPLQPPGFPLAPTQRQCASLER